MADTTTTTNMALVLPTVSVRLGNQFAVDINACLTRLDAHDHTPGYGVQIPVSGLYIAGDLNINAAGSVAGNNLTGTRSLRMVSQAADISGATDVYAVYVKAGNLWYNPSAGTHVQITAGGALAGSGTSSIVWPRAATTVDLTIGAADPESYLEVDSTGTRTITLPACTSAGAGRFYWIVDGTGHAGDGTHFITILPNASVPDTIETAASFVMQTNYEAVGFVSDGVSKWHIIRSAHAVNGAQVPKAGALTTGHVLKVTGTSLLAYDYVKDINVDAAAAIAGSKITPAAAGVYGTIQIGTDFGGTAAAPTVVQLTGSGGVVVAMATEIQFHRSVPSPVLRSNPLSGSPSTGTFQIIGQNSGVADGTGGAVRISSGSDLTNETNAGLISFYRGARPLFEMRQASPTDSTFQVPPRTTGGAGGDLTVNAQAGLTSGGGGGLYASAGAGAGAGATGGQILLSGGASGTTTGQGGAASLVGGNALGSGAGGAVSLTGGASSTGRSGSLSMGWSGNRMVQVVELASNQRVVALCRSSLVTTTELPAGSGDGVVYLGICTTEPTAAPVSGVVIYFRALDNTLRCWKAGSGSSTPIA